jgi:ArsR family transcriptional regulator, arsenate/arsenite/antimonite-responsive transcriptional repressor
MNKIESICTKDACCTAREDDAQRLYTDLEERALLFRALADETRLAILRQLREHGEVCACDFMACCRLAQPTVSHHLQILRRAGLVKADKRGLWVYYTLNEGKLASLKGLIP